MSRLSPGTIIVGIFAVLFGLVGAYAIRRSLQQPTETVAVPVLNNVPVASIDLEAGRPLTLGDIAIMRLTTEQIQERELPDGYMTLAEQIIGRTLREPIKRGDPFFTPNFYPQGMGPSVAERLQPGLRAVTVPIASTAAVAGMATPGSVVDVLFRTQSNAEDALPETTITLLERVEVLALGESVVQGARAPNGYSPSQTTVTLAVSPEQAAALKVVEGRGELMLTLRSPDDLVLAGESDPQTLDNLLGLVQPPPPVTTEVYRGLSKQINEFPVETRSPVQVTALPVRPRAATRTAVPVSADAEADPLPTVAAPTQPADPAPPTTVPTAGDIPASGLAPTPARTTGTETANPPAASPFQSTRVIPQPKRPTVYRSSSARPASAFSTRLNQRPEPRPSIHFKPTPSVSLSLADLPDEPVKAARPVEVAGHGHANRAAQPAKIEPPKSPAVAVSAPTPPESTFHSAVPAEKQAPMVRPEPVAKVATTTPSPRGRFTTDLFAGTQKNQAVFVDGVRIPESAAAKDKSVPAPVARQNLGTKPLSSTESDRFVTERFAGTDKQRTLFVDGKRVTAVLPAAGPLGESKNAILAASPAGKTN